MSHGDTVTVQQVCQPLLPGGAPRIPLKHKHPENNDKLSFKVSLSSRSIRTCVYREILYDLLQQSSVGQQLVVQRRVLQQHGEDLPELWQLLLIKTSNMHRLQNNPKQTRNAAERGHARAPNRLPVNVTPRRSELLFRGLYHMGKV